MAGSTTGKTISRSLDGGDQGFLPRSPEVARVGGGRNRFWQLPGGFEPWEREEEGAWMPSR